MSAPAQPEGVSRLQCGWCGNVFAHDCPDALRTQGIAATHYVAILDTGGISYSGRTFVAVAGTARDAEDAAADALLAGGPRETPYGDTLRTVGDVRNYYGIKVYGPIQDGAAVEVD